MRWRQYDSNQKKYQHWEQNLNNFQNKLDRLEDRSLISLGQWAYVKFGGHIMDMSWKMWPITECQSP